MQERLGLPISIGALDFNLGCSGFVYGLSLADGLIRSGSARRVLLITAETYSKYIDPTDRSLRTIFGDGAAATLIEAADETVAGIVRFRHRRPRRRHPDRRPRRGPAARGAPSSRGSGNAGPAASTWTARNWSSSPSTWCRRWSSRVLAAAGWSNDDVDLYLIHQATTFMLNHLPRAHGPGRGAHARGPGRIRQHRLLDDSHLDARPAGRRAACGRANRRSWSASASGSPGPAAHGPRPGSPNRSPST